MTKDADERSVVIEGRGSVSILWLNRPAVLNAISLDLKAELIAAIEELSNDSEVGAAVLAGRGRAFSSGADRSLLAELQDAPPADRAASYALGARVVPVPWESRADALDGLALLVNTTSLGMAGQPELALDLDPLPASALVTDIVYTPLETPLLARARARGTPAVDGRGMVLHQARPGFEAWFGVAPEVTAELRALVLAR